MKPLLLGLGLQGKATLHDFESSSEVERIVVAEREARSARDWIEARGYRKPAVVELDADDGAALARVIETSGCDIVVCMLPAVFNPVIAKAAIDAGLPFVSTSYAGKTAELDGLAKERGVTVLPEMGFDPGIDLVLARLAIDSLDDVEGLNSYGAGVPEPSAADNPLKYKITWTFDGVLKAYKRDARLLIDGEERRIPGTEIFRPENTHEIDVPGLGLLEAYPNGDAMHFAQLFGLGKSLRRMGRYAARWPGHCAFWRSMAELDFLSDEPTRLGGGSFSPREFLVHHLTPRLQFAPHERDVAFLRVEAWGRKAGRARRIVYDLLDYRDLQTGLFAMNRTVGFTASIAAHLVARGEVRQSGVLSPARDVPGDRVIDELKRRGIEVCRRETADGGCGAQ